MNVEEFVTEAMSQLFRGIKKAGDAASEVGGAIVAEEWGKSDRASSGDGRPVMEVELDIAVTVEDRTGGKGGIRVASIGIEGGKESGITTVTRIRTKVPVVFPASEPRSAGTGVAAAGEKSKVADTLDEFTRS